MKRPTLSSGTAWLCLPLLAGQALGCSAAEPEPWNGNTYLLDITAANWAEPRGIGREIDDFVPSFLIRIEGEARDDFEVVMGTALADGSQDTCNRTSRLSATGNPPTTAIGPAEFPLHVQHVNEPVSVDGIIYDLTITNVLPKGEKALEAGEFTATMDFRQLYPLFTALIERNPDTVCAAFEQSYTIGCEPCPTDGEPYCLTVTAIELGAAPNDFELADIDAVDPSCAPTPEP